MIKIFSFTLIVSILVILGASCTKSTFSPGAAAIPKAANGWWVTWSTEGAVQSNHIFFSTYNTSANQNDSMWIDDLGTFWNFKGTVALNYQALTFSNPLCMNVYYGPDTAIVANGKVLPLAGHSTTGVVTDSLYLEMKFSDDDDDNGNPSPYFHTWIISGTARTGFIADDY